jgi:hypothetical protein
LGISLKFANESVKWTLNGAKICGPGQRRWSMGMLEVRSYFMTAHEIVEFVVLKSSISHFPGTGCEGNMGAGAVFCEQLPLGQFATLGPGVRFCAESGMPSKQIKTNKALLCITASIIL